MIFKGTATVLITPFTSDGVDFESLDRILDDQLAGGVDAVVVLGTTGEPATMSAEEKKAVIGKEIPDDHLYRILIFCQDSR